MGYFRSQQALRIRRLLYRVTYSRVTRIAARRATRATLESPGGADEDHNSDKRTQEGKDPHKYGDQSLYLLLYGTNDNCRHLITLKQIIAGLAL